MAKDPNGPQAGKQPELDARQMMELFMMMMRGAPGGSRPGPGSMPWPPGAPPPVMLAWLMSWFLWPGMPFPGGPGASEAWRFANTRADFWGHLADAMGDVFRQAANASYDLGHEWSSHDHRIDTDKLRNALSSFPAEEREQIIHAVRSAKTFTDWYERKRGSAGSSTGS